MRKHTNQDHKMPENKEYQQARPHASLLEEARHAIAHRDVLVTTEKWHEIVEHLLSMIPGATK